MCRGNFLFYEDIWAGALVYSVTTSRMVLVVALFPWPEGGWGGVASAPCFRTRVLLQGKFTYFKPKQ